MLENSDAQARVSNLETNLRALDGRVWALGVIAATLIGGLYVYIGNKTEVINDRMTTLELTVKDVQSDLKVVKKDIEIIKKDIESIHDKLDTLLKK